ncbi:MAG: sulfite exporter TauE/SafE family protein [Nanoarchaeota archaeon]|nr:sulfite exporter TauE/SafE family protein [Nanoarchaeota archaeon]
MEFIDAFAGMGFGIVTPILLLLGYMPHNVVFAVLVNSAVLSISAGIFHHWFKNVDFSLKSQHFKISAVLLGFGILSIFLGVLSAIEMSDKTLKIYIGAIFLLVGIILLLHYKKKHEFSWKKLIAIGMFASFNKGVTAGGFGPILTGGQVISGIESRQAVGISSIVEGFVSLFGVIFYLIIVGTEYLNPALTVSLMIGGLLATPLAAYAVKRIHPKKLKMLMGIACIALGLITIVKIGF